MTARIGWDWLRNAVRVPIVAMAVALLVLATATARSDQSCRPQSKFQAIGTASGFNGLGIDYAVDGIAIDEFEEWRRLVRGYPTGSSFTVTFTVRGPHSIEGSWATTAAVSVGDKTVESVRAPDKDGSPGWTHTMAPVTVKVTEDIGKNGLRIAANVGYARSSNAEDTWVTVSARGCPTWSEPAGNTWEVVGGGLAAVAAAAAVIRAIRRRRRRSDDGNDDDHGDDFAGYVLQIDPPAITLPIGKVATLTVTVWAVSAAGGETIASDARIDIAVPADASYLRLAPSSGMGSVAARLSLVAQPDRSTTVTLSITAQTPKGDKTATADVTIGIETLVVEAIGARDFGRGPDDAAAFVAEWSDERKTWVFGDLVAWFAAPGDRRPVRPSFVPTFERPTTVPAILGLKFTGPTTDGETWRWTVALKPGAKVDDEWLLDGGRIEVTVRCRPEGGSP